MRALLIVIAGAAIAACDSRPKTEAVADAARPAVRMLPSAVARSVQRGEEPLTREEVNRQVAQDRVIVLGGEVDDDSAAVVIAKLLFLEDADAGAPIYLVIDSPGGSVTAGLSVVDTMRKLKAPVWTVCSRRAHSTAALIFAAGRRGERFVNRGCTILLHEPYSHGTAPDAKEREAIQRLRAKMVDELSGATNRPGTEVEERLGAEALLSAPDAVKFGLADHVVEL